MNIFLIGLPGSGKSTLGRKLAQILGFTLVDTDAEIVAQEGESIEAIFKHKGETYFRETERAVLHKIAASPQHQLISTGGGMPCFFDNIEFMNQSGIPIFIDVPIEALQKRLLGQNRQNRPMLANKSEEEVLIFLQQKYQERFPFYSKATLSIRGATIRAKNILDLLEKNNYVRQV
jgi:shikimate kinase